MGKLASAQPTGPMKMVVGADGPIFAMVLASAEAYGSTDYACSAHGRKSRGGGRGDESPQNLQWGTLIQVVPPDFCHFSKFQALAMDSSPPQISTQIYATGSADILEPFFASTYISVSRVS
jgi:hypothetical protein